LDASRGQAAPDFVPESGEICNLPDDRDPAGLLGVDEIAIHLEGFSNAFWIGSGDLVEHHPEEFRAVLLAGRAPLQVIADGFAFAIRVSPR